MNLFVKKYWMEEGVLFYLHFENSVAVRQIEVTNQNKTYLSVDTPIQNDSFLYDQTIEELNLEDKDFITKDEFEKVWRDQN